MKRTLWTALILLSGTTAAAQVIESQPLFVTGSRIARHLSEVPAQTYVITREEIDASPASSVLDLLNRIPGLTGVTGSAAMTLNQAVTVRGLFTEVLLLVDGIPQSSPSHGTGTDSAGYIYDLRALPLSSVERIEVVKGAGSALYGSAAGAGVISITTRTPAQKSTLSLSAEAGSDGWYTGSAEVHAAGKNGLNVSVRAAHTQEGERRIKRLMTPLALSAGRTHDLSRQFRGDDAALNLSWQNWEFSAAAGTYLSRWDATQRRAGIVTTDEAGQKNRYSRFSLAYDDGVQTARLYHLAAKKDYWQTGVQTAYRDTAWGASWSQRTRLLGSQGAWGAEIRREQSKGAGSISYSQNRFEAAPFAEISIPLGEAVIDAGLRAEFWDMSRGGDIAEILPRVSLSWQNAAGTLHYISAGRFLSMPSLYEMSAGTGPMNPDLDPERGWSYDIGIKNNAAQTPWSANLFFLEMSGKIRWISDPTTGSGTFQNMNRYRAWGAEAQATLRLGGPWSWTQGLSFVEGSERANASSDWQRTGMPRWDISGRLSYSCAPWGAEAELHYYADPASLPMYDSEDRFFVLNLALSRKSGNQRFKLAVTNVFNTEVVINYAGFITPERRVTLSWQRDF
ncbi:MAG: TonB-dependent receptor [Pyramidobacter sp.]|nr:TonB-dependent receptor [Pyramidobacter sp.]